MPQKNDALLLHYFAFSRLDTNGSVKSSFAEPLVIFYAIWVDAPETNVANCRRVTIGWTQLADGKQNNFWARLTESHLLTSWLDTLKDGL